ncbi:hypothetical protein [Methanolapillus millepedarum]|uniref:Type II toxin-antitoxin system Phd/YefM family antitoxin n=1 Tax=Methanolapillus millepedarum TaxID=3028296 RepID=A0AA96ZW02_9EURY|nr:hypothetical protein MsAc7_16030 [Methanosarcinaceae archaeon Ac7]
MPNIKPVSDLRNYNEILKDITAEEPVFLTKNGYGKYVIMDIESFEKQYALIQLLSELAVAENSIQSDADWISDKEMRKRLGVE